MRWVRLRMVGVPIFWQTLMLIFASVIVTQAVSFLMLFAIPLPRPDFNRLTDVAEALVGGTATERGERTTRDRALIGSHRPTPPETNDDLITDAALTNRLAAQIGVTPDRVRLYFQPDSWINATNDNRRRRVPIRRGEAIFFNTVVAGLQTGNSWHIVQTKPPPWFGPYQQRSLIWFSLSAILLLPFAWFFARRLTRPIRSFADAADKLGSDPFAPRVPEEGPIELRRTAIALNSMQERLATYLSERTAMIGAIAHDLRTPLARIAFRIEAAPDNLRDKVQQDVEQMRAMIAATLGFVKGVTQSGERAPIDLSDMLTGMVAAEHDVGRPVSLGPVEPLTVLGNRIALERLVQNLIDNGIAYGREVTVELEREDRCAAVKVIDQGPGLPDEQIARMFQPFERGEKSRNRATGGVGLGLTIARAIAEAHGGTLELRNCEAGGVAAECRFPLAA